MTSGREMRCVLCGVELPNDVFGFVCSRQCFYDAVTAKYTIVETEINNPDLSPLVKEPTGFVVYYCAKCRKPIPENRPNAITCSDACTWKHYKVRRKANKEISW